MRRLTPRETEVFHLLRQGLSNREIGERMFIEESSVKMHVTNLFKKTGFTSRAKLIYGAAEILGSLPRGG
jgi:two-component system response regulator DevR